MYSSVSSKDEFWFLRVCHHISNAVYVWGRGEVHTGLCWGNLRERDYLEDPGIDGRIILRWIFRKLDGGVEWIGLAQDRDKWRTLVNAVVNLRVP